MRADIAERESEGTGEDLFVVKLDHEGSTFLNLHLKEVLIVLKPVLWAGRLSSYEFVCFLLLLKNSKLLLKNESSDFDGSMQMSLKDAASHTPIVREPVSIRNRR